MLDEEWNSDLSDVGAGDWIATIKYGWIQVSEVYDDGVHPIVVKTKTKIYTDDGKEDPEDCAPSAFIMPPEWLLNLIGPHPYEFERDEVVFVSDDKKTWCKRHFIRWDSNGYKCVSNGRSLKTMRGEECTHWKYAKKLEG
jgi:hypothetical protein